jgi:hypothetical protein
MLDLVTHRLQRGFRPISHASLWASLQHAGNVTGRITVPAGYSDRVTGREDAWSGNKILVDGMHQCDIHEV